MLQEKARHVERHRSRLVKDAAKATAAADRRYAELIDQAEHARQEVVGCREAELWAMAYPDAREGETKVPQGLAGNLKVPLKKIGTEQPPEPSRVFELLRVDAEWLPTAIEGELKAKLGEAAEDGAVWADTDSGKEWQAEQQRQTRERIERAKTWGTRGAEWGEPPATPGGCDDQTTSRQRRALAQRDAAGPEADRPEATPLLVTHVPDRVGCARRPAVLR